MSLKSIFPKPIYLGAATRTPIGKFGGSLQRFTAPQLATLTLKAALSRAPSAKTPDFVFLGHARQAGCGPNPARQMTVFAGLAETVPAVTVNQACASGLTAIFSGMEKIALGQASSVWAGGVESMSNTPYFLMQARWGQRLGHGQVVDGMHQDGFFCPMADMVMGSTVEQYLAQELGISRREQDEYAVHSQQKAGKAWEQGKFADETFAIPEAGKLPGLSSDEHMRPDTNVEKLGKLPPVFDASGSVTAGNSSGITDGAAIVHVSDQKLDHMQVEVLDYQTVALDPKRMGLGPIAATEQMLKRQKLSVQDMEAVEINEAFAAQVIACQRSLNIPAEKLNPRGGAIALGHPIGATGARITTTLIHTLKSKPGALGIATLCVSGGQGVAVLLRAL